MAIAEIRNVMKYTAEAVAKDRGRKELLLESGIGGEAGWVIPRQIMSKTKLGNHSAGSINGILGDNPERGKPAVGKLKCGWHW